jgi:hypothetical protein
MQKLVNDLVKSVTQNRNVDYPENDFNSLRRLFTSQDPECLHRVCSVLAAVKSSTLPPWSQLSYSEDGFAIRWTPRAVLHVFYENEYEEQEEDSPFPAEFWFVVQTFVPPSTRFSSDLDTLLRDLTVVLS